MCERLPGESRFDMLGRLYGRAQIRADLLQLRAQQAESRAVKAEQVADKAIQALMLIDKPAAEKILLEA